jgi:Fe-S-cluster containining protein
MPALRFDTEQRFSCRQCGRCCRRGWDIAVTEAEVEGYRRVNARRWFVEDEDNVEGEPPDPFEPAGHGLFRIRKRSDGACGFLSPENRCRLHEELGAAKKPLTCRMFPFAVHPGGPRPVLTASLACPTVVEGVGARLGEQVSALGALAREWRRLFPAEARPVLLVPGHALDAPAFDRLRETLGTLLERRRPDGTLCLRENVGRMARFLEDLTRHRVLKLEPQAFAEYLSLTGGHAEKTDQPYTPRRPSPVSRLLGRGLLFAVLATREQLRDGRTAGLRLGLRLRLAHLLAHTHGLAPATPDVDLGKARGVDVPVNGPELQPLVAAALRNAVMSLGTGRRAVVEELALSVGLLRCALVMAAMRAGTAARTAVTRADFVDALVETADLQHAEGGGVLAGFLSTFAGGVEGLYLFAAGAAVPAPLPSAADR